MRGVVILTLLLAIDTGVSSAQTWVNNMDAPNAATQLSKSNLCFITLFQMPGEKGREFVPRNQVHAVV